MWVCGRFLASPIGSLPGEAFREFWSGFDPQPSGPRADLYRVNSGQFYTLEYCLDHVKTDIERALEEVTQFSLAKRFRAYFKLLPSFDEAPDDVQVRAKRFTELAGQPVDKTPVYSDSYNAVLKKCSQEYLLGDRQSVPFELLRHEFHVISDLVAFAEEAREWAVPLCLT